MPRAIFIVGERIWLVTDVPDSAPRIWRVPLVPHELLCPWDELPPEQRTYAVLNFVRHDMYRTGLPDLVYYLCTNPEAQEPV